MWWVMNRSELDSRIMVSGNLKDSLAKHQPHRNPKSVTIMPITHQLQDIT
jgi:hypothetical protein